jgi:hypothetical protein
METAIAVLAWTLSAVAVVIGIPVGAYFFARKAEVEVRIEAIKADTKLTELKLR